MKMLKQLVNTDTLNVDELMKIKGSAAVPYGCKSQACSVTACVHLACVSGACKSNSCNMGSCSGGTCSNAACTKSMDPGVSEPPFELDSMTSESML